MKFSIVTPSYNCGRFIAETIESVLSQKGDFEIDYFVVDGASPDGTVEILKKYDSAVRSGSFACRCRKIAFRWVSEKDGGMYDAVNRGFSGSGGDVFAYINADDVYLPGAFAVMARIFSQMPEVSWVKGITSYIDENSNITRAGRCYIYDREYIKNGIYGVAAHFIQQDSIFWRRCLWRESGGIDAGLRFAGDYDLWMKFAARADLYSVAAKVSCFRSVPGQLSENIGKYTDECMKLYRAPFVMRKKSGLYFRNEKLIPEFLRPFAFRLLFAEQRLKLIEFAGDGKPFVRRAGYYVI